jgi:hypothetical protein
MLGEIAPFIICAEAIENDDIMSVRDQTRDDIGADEAGPACDENHDAFCA